MFLLDACTPRPAQQERPHFRRATGGYPQKVEPAKPGNIQSGSISYYGKKFAGRKTASGEIFNPRLMTAAHRTLPFGTRVKVTLLSTGKTVVVRINDRGPFAKGRILDVSKAAAEQIGLVQMGVGKAKVEVLD